MSGSNCMLNIIKVHKLKNFLVTKHLVSPFLIIVRTSSEAYSNIMGLSCKRWNEWAFQMNLHTYIPLTLYPWWCSRGILGILPRHQNYLVMMNTAIVTGGKPIAVWLQSISSVNAMIFLVAFYYIHGGNRKVLFFYLVPDTAPDV
jgi:hypothetical protein